MLQQATEMLDRRITSTTSSPASAEKLWSYSVVLNICAACWRWLLQAWKYWRFASSQCVFNIFITVQEVESLRRYGRWKGLKVVKLCS